MKATGLSPWLRKAAIAKSEASHSTVNVRFHQYISGTRSGVLLRKLSNAVMASLWRGKCIFPAVRGFIFREITYPPGIVRKHSKTTFQLFPRHRYWEFYQRTKTLRITAYGPWDMRYPRMSISVTATTDFASLKVRLFSTRRQETS